MSASFQNSLPSNPLSFRNFTAVKKYVQNWIKSGLVDWDITRDISWGVPVPDSKGQVFYGWFDNHLAYISTAVKFLNDKGIDGKEFWNDADIYHFVLLFFGLHVKL